MRFSKLSTTLSGLALAISAAPAMADTTLATNNGIIKDSLCVGHDCTDAQYYGTSGATLRLKYQRNRIESDDTSLAGGNYPANDWALLFNDNDAGGAEYFSVSDETAGVRPFTIAAGAPENALYVAANGRIGLGTMLPATDLHILNLTGTASLRLEETAGTPYAWDIRGNNNALFVYDPQNFSDPFQIKHGAPTDSLVVDNTGGIGLGVADPQAALHLKRTNGTAEMLVEDASVSTSPRTLLDLKNNGRPEIVMANTGTGGEWSFGAGTNFILKQGAVGTASSAKTKLFEVKSTGDATLAGTLTTGGPSCSAGCDAVFNPDYPLPSIEEHAHEMRALGYLPNVGPTPKGQPIDLTDKLGRMLNELEHAHLYIAQQNDRIATLESDLATVHRRLEALER